MEEKEYESLFAWMNLPSNSKVLLLGNEVKQLATFQNFKECNSYYWNYEDILDSNVYERYDGIFDFVISVDLFERAQKSDQIIFNLKRVLSATGRILIGADNRLGIKYFCGEADPYTGRCFENLAKYEGYDKSSLTGKCYTKAELDELLKKAGLKTKFYSIFPTLEKPQLIIAEDYTPRERVSMRYLPIYENPDTIFFHEETLCSDFFDNGMLHAVANGFLIECAIEDNFFDEKQITSTLNRDEENAYFTIIYSDRVEKRSIREKGRSGLEQLCVNHQRLQERGIPVVMGKVKNNSYFMPYIDAPTGDQYLRQLLCTDAKEFLKCMDEFRNLIFKSSEHIREDEKGIILREGVVDMIPINSFFWNNQFVFFDQEFCIPEYPLNAILYRSIVVIYEQTAEEECLVPQNELYDRYGMSESLDWLNQITTAFVNCLRKQKESTAFNDSHMRNEWVSEQNRKKLNEMIESMDFYEQYRKDRCFDDLNDKKVFLFGAGKWCDKFLAFYKNECNVCRILDNDENKWGQYMHGIKIDSPESIVGEQAAYKVIICAKDYKPIFRQLKRMQVIHIGIYDANYFYAGRQKLDIFPRDGISKKYRIGYISGTFDVFHIGHINLLRRAKDQCDYLIVAVTTDEYVRTHKCKEPIIPFEERIEMIRACKYVDEAVEVPINYVGTVEAFQKYHFDCQFCGSDYEIDSWWQEQRDFLREHGSDLVFFPYTEQTNSTKIRALIENNI